MCGVTVHHTCPAAHAGSSSMDALPTLGNGCADSMAAHGSSTIPSSARLTSSGRRMPLLTTLLRWQASEVQEEGHSVMPTGLVSTSSWRGLYKSWSAVGRKAAAHLQEGGAVSEGQCQRGGGHSCVLALQQVAAAGG